MGTGPNHHPTREELAAINRAGKEAAQCSCKPPHNPYDKGRDPYRHIAWARGVATARAHQIKKGGDHVC